MIARAIKVLRSLCDWARWHRVLRAPLVQIWLLAFAILGAAKFYTLWRGL